MKNFVYLSGPLIIAGIIFALLSILGISHGQSKQHIAMLQFLSAISFAISWGLCSQKRTLKLQQNENGETSQKKKGMDVIPNANELINGEVNALPHLDISEYQDEDSIRFMSLVRAAIQSVKEDEAQSTLNA